MSTQADSLTLVNVFHVDTKQQEELLEVLTRTTQTAMKHQPGFISAHLYRGLEGTYVANYVQWRSREDFDRMWVKPEVQEHIAEVRKVAIGNPQLYELVNITTGILYAEHDITIDKPWEQCFELSSSLHRWAEFMPAVRKAEIVKQGDNDQEIELTAQFGDQVLTWRSWRELLPDSKLIRFRNLTPRPPLKALAGEWSFEPVNTMQTKVRVFHNFELTDPAQESTVRAGISKNMIGDLQGMKKYLEKSI